MPRAAAAWILLLLFPCQPASSSLPRAQPPTVPANQRDQNSRHAAGDSARPAEAVGPAVRVIDSVTLFGSRREVQIRHKGAIYTLRETRQGKLILNK